MSRAVAEGLKTAPTLPRDAGAVALAQQYAALIDAAAPSSAYAKHLRTLAAALDGIEFDAAVTDAFTKIREALAEHSVASDLGPKLLAVLTSLGMTAAGRAVKGGAPDGPKHPDELAGLRERARARRAR